MNGPTETLTFNHLSNERLMNLSYSLSQPTNGLCYLSAVGPSQEFRMNDVDCQNASYNISLDQFTQNIPNGESWDQYQIALKNEQIETDDTFVVVLGTLSCASTGTSATETPNFDEDCDGDFNNVETSPQSTSPYYISNNGYAVWSRETTANADSLCRRTYGTYASHISYTARPTNQLGVGYYTNTTGPTSPSSLTSLSSVQPTQSAIYTVLCNRPFAYN